MPAKNGVAGTNLPATADFAYRLSELVGSASVAILTTPGSTGQTGSCPLLIQRIDASGTVSVLGSKRAVTGLRIAADHPVALVIIPAQLGRHVILHGRGLRPADGHDTAIAHWHDGFRAWFPKGPEDSDLCLLEISLTAADCWDGMVHRCIEPVPAT